MKHECDMCYELTECNKLDTTIFKDSWVCKICLTIMHELKLFVWE